MAVINRMAQVLGELAYSRLAVHPERCVTVRNRNVRCARCADVCAGGAIALVEGGVEVDADRCIGCGSCAAVCPTAALEALNPSDRELSRCTAELVTACGGHVVLACAECVAAARDAGLEPAGFAEVVCLGRVDESLLLELAVRGAECVTLASGTCGGCEHQAGSALCSRVVATARELLAACERTLEVEQVEGLPAWCAGGGEAGLPMFPLDCEEMLTRAELEAGEVAEDAQEAGAEGADDVGAGDAGGDADADANSVATDSVDAEQDDSAEEPAPLPCSSPLGRVPLGGTLPQHVPERRTRLWNCLRYLGKSSADALEGGLETRLWGTVRVDADTCKTCRMCARFCPTGALTAYDAEGETGLVHRPTLCVGCGLCEGLCLTGALALEPAVDLDGFVRGRTVRIPLHEPEWIPNRPDSLYQRWSKMLGNHNMIAY